MSIIKLSKSVAFLVGTALSATPSVAIQCNSDTEALLKVSYKIDEKAWGKLFRQPNGYDSSSRKSPELTLRPSGNVGSSTSTYFVGYGSFKEVVDFETCIPTEGACVELTVSTFPTDSYSISWNGEAVNVGQEFTNDGHPITTTEIGDFCTPTCDKDVEALFDYEYWTAGTGYVSGFRVEDHDGNIAVGCSSPHGVCGSMRMHSMYRYRACLPKDACYTFITAHDRKWTPDSHQNENSPIFSYKYDGEVGETMSPTRFISSSFGSTCKPECNPDSESRVEFIMLRDHDIWCRPSSELRTDLDYNWELKVKGGVISSGVVPHCPDSPFSREVMCIPTKSCATFHIESQDHILTDSVSSYSLTVDGVSFRSSESNKGWDETTDVGDDCNKVGVVHVLNNLRGRSFSGVDSLRRESRS